MGNIVAAIFENEIRQSAAALDDCWMNEWMNAKMNEWSIVSFIPVTLPILPPFCLEFHAVIILSLDNSPFLLIRATKILSY